MSEPASLVRGPDDGPAVWFLGSLIELKAMAADTGGAYSVIVQTIPPGLNPAPPHRHVDKNEGFYVLGGSVTVQLANRRVEAQAGSFLYIPHGTVHGVWNLSGAPTRLLAVFEPGGFEQFFVELGETATTRTAPPRPSGPPDLARLRQVAQKYQTELLDPRDERPSPQ